MRRLPKEFELVVACCRWPRSSACNEAIVRGAANVNWPLLERVARRHRVEALVWDGLKQAGVEVPAETAASLAPATAGIARDNVLMAGECLRLDRLLAQEGVSVLVLKGLTLAMLAYGDLSLKKGWDIDLIVPSEQLATAVRLLRQEGYECILPATNSPHELLPSWHAHWKESVWHNDAKGTYIELHTSLVDNSLLLPGMGARSPCQVVEVVRGGLLRTLAKDELFAYLCVHGASSGWFRLKWIADLAALLSAEPAEEISRLYRRSQQLGAGRAAAQALLLASQLFGTNVAPDLERGLRAQAANRWLFRSALRLMAGRDVATELHDRPLATMPIHVMQLALLPGWRFKASELSRQMSGMGARIVATVRRRLQSRPRR